MEDTFHRFIDLPYDIRYNIYILATPPRVVRLEEGPLDPTERKLWCDNYDSYFDYAYEKFCKELTLDDSPNLNFKLHPDIAHFAHNWWPQLRSWSSTQQSLDAYGFTSSRPAYEPWKPSKDTPRIPTEWLIDSPELAFVLTRNFCLYSHAEIPVFLHVCVESRQALIEWGYRLFFSTRTAGPRTWFNPARDRLYIPFEFREFPRKDNEHASNQLPSIYPNALFSGSCWDIGLYTVQDLKAIKKVILGAPGMIEDQDLAYWVEKILPLLSNVEELFLEDWSLYDFEDWFDRRPGAPISPFHTAASIHCIPVEDIDVVGSVFWSSVGPYEQRKPNCYVGDLIDHFRPFKATSSESYHATKAKELEAELLEWKYTSKIAQKVDARIPTIRHVNLVPDACAELYLNSRHGLWKAISSLTDEEIREPNFRERFLEMNVFPLPFNIQWRSVEDYHLGWLELLDEMQRSAEELTDPVTDMHRLQAWYIMNRLKFTEPQSSSL
ncbi:uncharacterized protein FTOL_02550 [Fusarium torulosum]|uniref:2EXR domain-containing protein n=1 Tax=Fusarium torulosum TaxID=33205 RepID=A0AAE8M200_9HYPO|nr:uncharacterized protein FTOL_02550 [Fusarium torulosum]